MIYLDNASTTRVDDRVFEEMLPFLKDQYGNPGSIHELGKQARDAITIARKRVADAINADPCEIVFTSGGSESNNFAIRLASKIWESDLSGDHFNKILSSDLEHDSMKRAIEHYGEIIGSVPYYNSEEFVKQIAHHASGCNILSFMYVNNELGIVNPVEEICNLDTYSGFTVVDAVQALGNEVIDVRKMNCDFLSVSSHKIHGPKGVGALYIKKDVNTLRCADELPLIYGGDNQEFGLRGGTENVAGIVGFGKACELIDVDRSKVIISKLRKCFLNNLKFRHEVNCNREDSKIISLTIPGVDAETLVLMMSAMGVCISAGSACKSLEQKPNEVLLAAGLTEVEARSTVRISLSCYNTVEEMVEASDIINQCVDILGQK